VSNAPSKPVSFSRPKVGYFSNRPRILPPAAQELTVTMSNLSRKTREPLMYYNPSNTYKVAISHGKGRTIPLQAWTDPEGSRRLRLPDFKRIGT